jgi:hypothetical protein
VLEEEVQQLQVVVQQEMELLEELAHFQEKVEMEWELVQEDVLVLVEAEAEELFYFVVEQF